MTTPPTSPTSSPRAPKTNRSTSGSADRSRSAPLPKARALKPANASKTPLRLPSSPRAHRHLRRSRASLRRALRQLDLSATRPAHTCVSLHPQFSPRPLARRRPRCPRWQRKIRRPTQRLQRHRSRRDAELPHLPRRRSGARPVPPTRRRQMPRRRTLRHRQGPRCFIRLAARPEFATVRATLAKQLEDCLRQTGDARILNGGDMWETNPRDSSVRTFPQP